jgi:hypothetical protein
MKPTNNLAVEVRAATLMGSGPGSRVSPTFHHLDRFFLPPVNPDDTSLFQPSATSFEITVAAEGSAR